MSVKYIIKTKQGKTIVAKYFNVFELGQAIIDLAEFSGNLVQIADGPQAIWSVSSQEELHKHAKFFAEGLMKSQERLYKELYVEVYAHDGRLDIDIETIEDVEKLKEFIKNHDVYEIDADASCVHIPYHIDIELSFYEDLEETCENQEDIDREINKMVKYLEALVQGRLLFGVQVANIESAHFALITNDDD